MDFRDWLEQQELNEGLPRWTRKLAYPLIAAAAMGGSPISAADPYHITMPEPPQEDYDPFKIDPNAGIAPGPWAKDFETIEKTSGSKEFPHDVSYKALHQLKKEVLANPEFFKNLTAIIHWMHGTDFREKLNKLSGFKNIPNDASTRELFQQMWGQYKHPKLQLNQGPFWQSYSGHDIPSNRYFVKLGTAIDTNELPINPYLGTGHEYLHQTQGAEQAHALATDQKGQDLCELPTCLGEGIWILMAAEKQAKKEHRKSPFHGQTIKLPNGNELSLDFLINQAKRFNAFENPAKFTELLASPMGIAWLKQITKTN